MQIATDNERVFDGDFPKNSSTSHKIMRTTIFFAINTAYIIYVKLKHKLRHSYLGPFLKDVINQGGGVFRIVYVCRQGGGFPNCVRQQFSF